MNTKKVYYYKHFLNSKLFRAFCYRICEIKWKLINVIIESSIKSLCHYTLICLTHYPWFDWTEEINSFTFFTYKKEILYDM